MVDAASAPPGDPSHHKHFLELIRQLEQLFEKEMIAWSAASAAAAQRRLDRLTHALEHIVQRLEHK